MSADATEIWVARRLPYVDGSGTGCVLGAYSTEEGAQAACWRELQRLGYEQPTAVALCYLDDPESAEPTDD